MRSACSASPRAAKRAVRCCVPSGPDIAAFIGSSDPAMRYAGVRVLGRVFARRAQDEAIESTVGDAVITALNDNDAGVRSAAMQALGAMRYARGVQALSDLFTYHGKGEAAEAALIALAHIAHPASAPLFAAQLSEQASTAASGRDRRPRANRRSFAVGRNSARPRQGAGGERRAGRRVRQRHARERSDGPGRRLARAAAAARAGEAVPRGDRAWTDRRLLHTSCSMRIRTSASTPSTRSRLPKIRRRLPCSRR